MALAFDAVGPSSAGAAKNGVTPLTWSHVNGGNLLLASASVDTDAVTISSLTWGASTLTQVGSNLHCNASNVGYLALYKLVNAGAATATATVNYSATTPIEAGSLSFSGADTTTGIGTPQTATGTSISQPTMSFTGSTTGNIIAAFLACGNFISSATSPLTSRWINNQGGSNAAGMGAAATAPGTTGSPVTISWSITADFWAVIAVEVLVGGGAVAPATVAAGTGAALNAAIQTSNLTSGPRYAGTATDLGGGYGAWATPQFATGGP